MDKSTISFSLLLLPSSLSRIETSPIILHCRPTFELHASMIKKQFLASVFTKVGLYILGNILGTRKKSFGGVLRKLIRGKYPFLLPFLSKLDFHIEISKLMKKFWGFDEFLEGTIFGSHGISWLMNYSYIYLLGINVD